MSKGKVRFYIILVALVMLIGVISYYVINALILQSSIQVANDRYTFSVIDYYSGEEFDDDDYDISLYGCNVKGLTESQIGDLTFSDFTLVETLDSGESYTPKDNYIYRAKIAGTDYVTQWIIPVLGLNVVRLMNETEDVSILCYSKPAFSTTVGGTTYRDWVIEGQALDQAEGVDAKAAIDQGYMTNYDFENDKTNYVCIKIEFNTTAQLGWCEFRSTGYTSNEKVSGVYLYYEIDIAFLNSFTFEIRFGSTIGTAFEPVAISVGYGNADAGVTLWDTQA